NQLLCFTLFVGSWKETTPEDAIRLKREIDRTMYSYRVAFSPQLFEAYALFMESIFLAYSSANEDAKPRADIHSYLGNRRQLVWWSDKMEKMFAKDAVSPSVVQQSYDALGEQFRVDLYVTREELDLPAKRTKSVKE